MRPALTPTLADRLPLVEGIPTIDLDGPSPEGLAALDAFGAAVEGYRIPDADVLDTVAAGPHGDVPVRIYRPVGRGVTHGLVWAHGGAFVFGGLDMPESDVVARELVARAPIIVVAVDYRLCVDGIHFPVPHDDVHAAYTWAAESGLLPDAGAWAIGGASAGGNLAAGVAQRLRDESKGASALVLAYPVVHDRVPVGTAEHRARVESLPPVLRLPSTMTAGVNANFLGRHQPDVRYAFAALGDLGRLPPTLIVVGDHDELTPSGEDFARRLVESGVLVEIERVTGVPHGHLNVSGLPEALSSIDRIARFAAAA